MTAIDFPVLKVLGLIVVGLLVFSACQSTEAPLSHQPEAPLILVELTASDCSDCQQIHQIIQNIKPKYAKRLSFMTLDLSSSAQRLKAQETSRRFHGEGFIKRYQDRPGTVAILKISNGTSVGMLQNHREESGYIDLLETALSPQEDSSHGL